MMKDILNRNSLLRYFRYNLYNSYGVFNDDTAFCDTVKVMQNRDDDASFQMFSGGIINHFDHSISTNSE